MKYLSIITLCILVLASCSKSSLDSSFDVAGENYSQSEISTNGIAQNFKVRIENIASDTPYPVPFAPGLWIVQKKNSAPIFESGSSDFGDGLEDLAEDGNPGLLYESLNNHPKVRDRGVFNTPAGAAGPAPIFLGDAYEFYVTAKPNDFLNFATMFIQSNDLFIAPSEEGIALFDSHGNPTSGNITNLLGLWDAGTEVNEEPGVGPNQAPRQGGPNTGATENGVVQIVNDGFTYPTVSDIIRVTVHPVN